MARKQYDFVFGLGGACCCTEALRDTKMQLLSLPFDWVARSDLPRRADMLVNGFPDWLVKDAMTLVQEDPTNLGIVFQNSKNELIFPHDFHRNVPFDEEFPKVVERYRRRQERMLGLIASSKRVLAVWVDVQLSPFASDADSRYALDVLRRRWPEVDIELLHFRHEEGRKYADRLDVTDGKLRTVTFDYRDHSHSYWIGDHKLLARWLSREYSVRDYRTPAEKAEYRRKAKAAKYGRFHATGFWDFLRTKCEYKVFSHLRKRLEKKGLA